MSRTAARLVAALVVVGLGPAGNQGVFAQATEERGESTPEPSAASEPAARDPTVPAGGAAETAAPSAPEPIPETPEIPLHEFRLEHLRRGFPEGLPLFGAQLMGPPKVTAHEWKSLRIPPFYEVGVGDEIVLAAWGLSTSICGGPSVIRATSC